MDLAAVQKVDLFRNLRIYAYFQLPKAFHRLLHPSSSLGVGDKRTRTADIRHGGRFATPGCRRHPWGDLIVLTGWRRWGQSIDFLSFCCISFKWLKGHSTSSCSQGPTRSSSPRSQLRKPWESRRLQLPSIVIFWSSFLLLRKSESTVQVEETIITAWTIRHPTRNRNDPIARTELYQLSYNWSLVNVFHQNPYK
ncbi:hypothetical protein AHAS_Ahas18G0237300 [Arachis hypogaea]